MKQQKRNLASLILFFVLAICVAFLSGCGSSKSSPTTQTQTETKNEKQVPNYPEDGKDSTKIFFDLLKMKKNKEATMILDSSIVSNEAVRNLMVSNFNNIQSFDIKELSADQKELWKPDVQIYKGVINLKIKPGSPALFGWTNGDNTTWVTVTKKDGSYRITKIGGNPK